MGKCKFCSTDAGKANNMGHKGYPDIHEACWNEFYRRWNNNLCCGCGEQLTAESIENDWHWQGACTENTHIGYPGH